MFALSSAYSFSDLSKFIAAGRINAVIDKVGGIVETNRPDAKNAQYQSTIKQGDILLNRIQKLGRVINIWKFKYILFLYRTYSMCAFSYDSVWLLLNTFPIRI